MKKLHPIQEGILKLSVAHDNITNMSLSELAKLLNVEHLQQVKHHRNELVKKGLLEPKVNPKEVKKTHLSNGTTLVSIPVLGAVNAGPALVYAEGSVEGYLGVSSSLLPKRAKTKGVYALKVVGDSMNMAKIGPDKLSAENGDYVLAEGEETYDPKSGDYVISVLDGKANIKKLIIDSYKQQAALVSESTADFPPIVLHEGDELDTLAQSKVLQVIKLPKIR